MLAVSPEELQAAKTVALANDPDRPGVRHWEESDSDGWPFSWGEYRVSSTRRFTVALARPTRKGGRVTGAFLAGMVERLDPGCVAMVGVCAGNPARTALGDVVVAELVYQWDEGERNPSETLGDHRQIPLASRWARAAQDFDPAGLDSYCEASWDEASLWLLEQLHRGQEPRNHPALSGYFPRGTWKPGLDRLEAEGLIRRRSATGVTLTREGTAFVKRHRYDDVDGPQRLPFRVLTAPMASGSAVLADPAVWLWLRDRGMREIAAVEMEAAAIATVAHQRDLPWLVAKGVMNHGDSLKDDRYKQFAARASAEVMFALLGNLLADDGECRPTPSSGQIRPRPPVQVLSPPTLVETTRTRRWGRSASVAAALLSLACIPMLLAVVSSADEEQGRSQPYATSSSPFRLERTPKPTTSSSGSGIQPPPDVDASPRRFRTSPGPRTSKTRATPPSPDATETSESPVCPKRHVGLADKTLEDGDAFTVADFHQIWEPTDQAANQPRIRVSGGTLRGENGARLRLLRGVPEADRLDCTTGGTAYSQELALASIRIGDVIVARTSEYVGKLEITGTGENVLRARTTSYFLADS